MTLSFAQWKAAESHRRYSRKGWKRKLQTKALLKRYLVYRDGAGCQYCGRVEKLTIDHIHPKSKGGPNHPSNYQLLCLECNQRKADSAEDEFAGRY